MAGKSAGSRRRPPGFDQAIGEHSDPKIRQPRTHVLHRHRRPRPARIDRRSLSRNALPVAFASTPSGPATSNSNSAGQTSPPSPAPSPSPLPHNSISILSKPPANSFTLTGKPGKTVRLLGVQNFPVRQNKNKPPTCSMRWTDAANAGKQALSAADHLRDRFGESAVSLGAGMKGRYRETHPGKTPPTCPARTPIET